MKTGVIRADLYDPLLNRAYAEMAEHYGCLIDPARAQKPKDKPRVERVIQYVRDSFWRGRSFASLTDMQTRAVSWCREVAGVRAHRSLEGASPLAVFAALEAPALLGLPARPFELARWLSPKVAPDCQIVVDKVLYSVPWTHVGASTDTRVTDTTVAVHVDGKLVKTWPKAQRGRCTDEADYPPEKIAFFSRNPVWCRSRARDLGPHVAELVDTLLAVQALHRLRSAQGVIGLAERHGPDRLDAACARALAAGDLTYRTVRGILAAGTEGQPAPGQESADPAADAAEAAPSVATPAHLHGPAELLAHLRREDTPDPARGASTGDDSSQAVAE